VEKKRLSPVEQLKLPQGMDKSYDLVITRMEILDYLRGSSSFWSREKAEEIVTHLTGEDPLGFYAEVDASQFYSEMKSRKEYLTKNKLGNVPIETEGKFLYALCRALKPEKVVETGPGTGISSSFILKALEANGSGEMWSIEAGVLAISPLKLNFGQFVPESLRGRWHLIMGESEKLLPNLLNDLKSVDFFFHDSDHSYENMSWEFEKAWPYVRKGGILAADDINFNNAFRDFCSKHQLTPAPYSRFSRFGVVKK
jgi:predicted O-methyltransferase YrrM